MALTRSDRPVLDGLRPVQGTIRMWALRLGLVVVMSLPALFSAMGGVSSGVARSPYYTDITGRMPVLHMARMARELPTMFLPMTLLGIALAVLGDQLLLGGGAALFNPERPQGGRVRVLEMVLRDGLPTLWAFLRAVLLGILFSAIGARVISSVFERISRAGTRASWTGETTALTLPLISFVLITLWLATIGAWVFWCRLITAADGRRLVRRTGVLVWRVFARSPLRSWGMFVGLTLVSILLSGAVLFAWRQAEPRSVGAVLLWAMGWLSTLAVQAFVWVWLLRSGRLLYASARFSDLRARPDEPFYIFRKLLWWRKKRATEAPETKRTLANAPASNAPESNAREAMAPEAMAPEEAPEVARPEPAAAKTPEQPAATSARRPFSIDMDLPVDSSPPTEPDPDAGSKPPPG